MPGVKVNKKKGSVKSTAVLKLSYNIGEGAKVFKLNIEKQKNCEGSLSYRATGITLEGKSTKLFEWKEGLVVDVDDLEFEGKTIEATIATRLKEA
jgi:hypothetical protein